MDIVLGRFHESIAVEINGVNIPCVYDYEIKSSAIGAIELLLKIRIPKKAHYQELHLSANREGGEVT